MRPPAPRAGLLALALACAIGPAAAADTDEAAALAYAAQPRDTLIGIGRRLLREPARWPDVQRLNHIVDPRRIPRGATLRLPYAWLRMRDEAATVAAATGEVRYVPSAASAMAPTAAAGVRAGSEPLAAGVLAAGEPLAAGQHLSPGAVVATGAEGSATLDLADGSVVTLQPSSTLILERMAHVEGLSAAHDIRLKLASGRLESAVKPHRDVGRFEIATPVAVSAVRGTQLRNGFVPAAAASQPVATTETLDGTVNVATADVAAARATAPVPVAAGFGTRVLADQAPLPPVPLLPPPDLGGVSATNATPALRLAWPPLAGAQAYRVQFATDAEFHAVRADARTTEPTVVFADLPDGSYWLRARGIDPNGIEGRDATRQLTQHRLPPAPLALVATRRAGGPVGPGGAMSLSWQAPAPGLRYRVELARDANFATGRIDLEALSEARAELGDLAPGAYVWRVAAVGADGAAGEWSAAQFFTVPPPPPLVAIEVGADRAIHVRWPARAGTTYRLQLARTPDFRRVLLDRHTGGGELDLPPQFPGAYYVRAQTVALDGTIATAGTTATDDTTATHGAAATDGVAGDFGPARRFEAPPPLWLKIVVSLGALAALLH